MRSNRDMRRFWNARAREDAFHFVDNREAYKAADLQRFWDCDQELELYLESLGLRIEPTDTILDIGCGVGRLSRALSKRAATVIALDVSDEMLRRAQELNQHLTNVTWLLGDGASLTGIEDRCVDGCVSIVVFQHMPSPDIALAYIRDLGRVLRPGGWAALSVSNDPAVHRPHAAGPRWLLASLLGRAPRGARSRPWTGSWVEVAAVRKTAAEAALELQNVLGEGTQYCQLLLRKPSAA